jgi:hypothetical protein
LGDFTYTCFVDLLRYSTPRQDEAREEDEKIISQRTAGLLPAVGQERQWLHKSGDDHTKAAMAAGRQRRQHDGAIGIFNPSANKVRAGLVSEGGWSRLIAAWPLDGGRAVKEKEETAPHLCWQDCGCCTAGKRRRWRPLIRWATVCCHVLALLLLEDQERSHDSRQLPRGVLDSSTGRRLAFLSSGKLS